MKGKAKWIKADIDGTGHRWRLAVEVGEELVFVMEGFTDTKANYDNNLWVPVVHPDQVQRFIKISELALSLCKTACGTYNDKRSSVDRRKLSELNALLRENPTDEELEE